MSEQRPLGANLGGMRVTVLGLFAFTLAGMASPSRAATPEAQRRLLAHDARVKELLGRMTLAEKVGQMTQPEAGVGFEKNEADVAAYFLGSLLSGGGADPKTNSLADWTELYDRLQGRALTTRLKLPLLYGVDAVHGHNNVIGAVVFPHNIGLGAARSAALVEEINRVTAREVRATGIQWNFAPCVAVVRDIRWGRTYESFSEDPQLVAELGAAAVRGLQGPKLGDAQRVLACAKHFVADGGTAWKTGDFGAPGRKAPLDQGDARIDEATLRRLHLPGYVSTIAAGVASIMPSFSSWNGEKVSGSRRLLTELLKQELGFEGFLISDYNAIDQLPGDYRSDIKQSINAGMDMVMVPQRYREFFTTLVKLVEAGEVPLARIDDAVTRILRAKAALGLLDAGRSQLADRSLQKDFGGAAHRQLARRAVRESLVLLKNERRALPLRKNAGRIHVAGKNADDLGNQCGGWTIDWQGKSGAITQGTTILAALRSAAPSAQVTYAKDGAGAHGADVGVVVVGETPYAEGPGDREDIALDDADRKAIANVKQAGIPLVLVVVSGRPLVLGDAAAQADAIVAAWLPGSEGAGVADVLFGDHKPTGKLSFSWPRSNEQLPQNRGDARYEPLFPFGHGLGY
jgi:beta-glucosidase